MWKWLARLLRIRDSRNRALRITEDELELRDAVLNEQLSQIKWSDIDEIVAFKVDAIVMDHLCLGFRARNQTKLRVTDEETPGWKQLNERLDRDFGVIYEQWAPEVAHPPFKENGTTLWRRSAN